MLVYPIMHPCGVKVCNLACLTLVYIGGGDESTQVLLIFFYIKKLSPRPYPKPTCKFQICAIFYHAKKFPEYKKSFTI